MALRREADHWVWEGGPVPPGSDAITVWRVISVRKASADDAHLMRHEQEHLRQWRELGVFGFLSQYLGAYARGRLKGFPHRAAYRMIPLEVEAREAADEARRQGEPPSPAASETERSEQGIASEEPERPGAGDATPLA
ncbi:MAG TPA: hypothetical protein VG078_10930 [Acidimicrobiales bacterium]|nr:hypothetical protein [Acidimicrobiales bacterium]